MDWEQLKLQIKTNPRNSLRFVAGLAVTLVMLWILVLVQANTGEEERYVDLETLRVAAVAASETDDPAPATVDSRADSGSSGLPLITFLLLAGGIMGYGWFRKGKS